MRLLLLAGLLSAVQAATVPGPPGPYGVASRVLALTDDARQDPFSPKDKRRIVVSAFLPVDKTSHACQLESKALMPPLTASLYDQQAVTGGLPNDTFSRFDIQYCKLPAKATSGKDSCAGSKHPVVLFSPGLGATRLAYSAGARTLASHGNVVITIDHPHDAAVVEFPDAAVAYGNVNQTDPAETLKALNTRVADVLFLVEQLHGKSESLVKALTKDYPGRLDVDKLLLYGHSIGGNTAANAMLRDGRIRAGANLDGHVYGPVVDQGLGLRAPFLLVGVPGHDAMPGSNWPQLYDRLRAAKMDVEIAQTQHLTWTDVPLLATQMAIAPENRPLVEQFIGTIDGKRMQDVMLEVLTGLVELGVKGKSQKLRGLGDKFDEVTVVKSRLP